MKSLYSSKKGQLQDMAPAIIALVLAAVFLVFGLIITQALRDVDTLKNTASVTNESGGYINESGYILAAENGDKTNGFSIAQAWNTTGGGLILAGNFTVNSVTGNITNATTANFDPVNFTYSYQTGEEAWDASNTTIAGLGTFADFWEIIVLAIIISIVIGLLLAVFGGRSRQR